MQHSSPAIGTMKSRLKLYLKFNVFFAVLTIILFGSIYFLLFSGYTFPSEEKAVYTFLESKLNGLPKGTTANAYEKDFSMDHAWYIVTIQSPKTEIKKWLERNRNFKNAHTIKTIDGKNRFSFSKPFNGIVEIDSSDVKINVVGSHIIFIKD